MKDTLKAIGFILTATAIASGLTAWLHPRAPVPPSQAKSIGAKEAISVTEVRAYLGEILWVDARHLEDFEASHIEGSILLNEDHWDEGFAQFVAYWYPEQLVIVYCNAEACQASKAVARRLRQNLGEGQFRYLEGGYPAWTNQ